MKAIVSTTYDDKYLFFLPIVTYCWNKLGVDVICFMPEVKQLVTFAGWGDTFEKDPIDLELGPVNAVYYCLNKMDFKIRIERFSCPEHKEATYAQCSRLYAAALKFPKDTILIVSDVDMAIFKRPPTDYRYFNVLGYDLVPPHQYPMCYVSAGERLWRKYFTNNRTLQKCLDDLLGDIECESFRGNYWGKDQQTLYSEMPKNHILTLHQRARPGTQFASNRCDRDDTNWRSYLGLELFDAHLWRPGYEENNFANIMELLQTQYPEDNFQWLIDYRNQYIQLL